MNEILIDPELDLDQPIDEPVRESAERQSSKTERIEHVITLITDSLWAGIGLVLWLPQIVRVVIISAMRLIHAMLTRQPIDSIRGSIRRVAHFYGNGFLSRGQSRRSGSYGSTDLRFGRFVLEVLWVGVVWLLALRIISQNAFDAAWTWLATVAVAGWELVVRVAGTIAAYLPDSVRPFFELGTAPSIALTVLLLLFLLGGILIGRRH